MKKNLLLFLLLILSINSYAQNIYKEAYFIDNSNQKTDCLIKAIDWRNNPTEFEYKLSETAEAKTADIEAVQEFGIYQEAKYLRANVKIDRSSEVLSKLSEIKDPEFKEEDLFFKVLIQGKASLYEYLDKGLTRYFYEIDNSQVKQLVNKSYKTTDDKVAKNNQFKQQLADKLKCPNFSPDYFKNVDYFKSDLVRVFTEFNECSNSDLVYSEPEVERDVFNLTIRPRLNSSSLTIENSDFNARDIINFGNKVGFGIGLEAELILPIKKDKWSIFIEPTYQSSEAETVNTEVSVIFGGEIESKITYNSIEIPLGLRHYFLLNENSKIFVDLAYIFDLSSNSKFEFDRSDSSITNAVVLETEQNMAIGVGFKLQEKYSLELRYQASRELIKQNAIWSSDYETFSVIFGYTIF